MVGVPVTVDPSKSETGPLKQTVWDPVIVLATNCSLTLTVILCSEKQLVPKAEFARTRTTSKSFREPRIGVKVFEFKAALTRIPST